MAMPLSPSEQVAQAMLLYHTKAPAEALSVAAAVSAAVANVFDNDPDPSAEEIDGASLAAVQQLGYLTTLESISRQYDYLQNSHAGFWAGNYTLLDARGGVHSLLIDSSRVRLLLDGTDTVLDVPSEGGGFADRVLRVDNDRVAVAFALSTTLDTLDLLADGVDLEDVARRYAVLLSGTLTVKGDALGARSIQGKRGVATPAGVHHEFGEEPPWIWAGEYQLRYTDTALWEEHPDALVIACDATTRALSVRLGALQATAVFYRNGVICCRLTLAAGIETQVTLAMLATRGGGRKAYAWFETTGQIRTLTAYARDRLDAATLCGGPSASPGPPLSRLLAMKAGASDDDFARTPYDTMFSAADLAAKPDGTADGKAIAAMFGIDTLHTSDGKTVTGLRMDERDEQQNLTGRVAMFAFDAATPPTYAFPAGATLKAYQQLDATGRPQAGLGHARVGVLSPAAFPLPAMVRNDYYSLRLSLTGHAALDADGLRIGLAIDDAAHPGILALLPPTAADAQCPYDPNTGGGQDPAASPRIEDYTKASVLVRGARAGILPKGTNTYCFSVAPGASDGFFQATRTIYKPSATAGTFELDGSPATVPVPALMRVSLPFGACDDFTLVNATWPTAIPGKSYGAQVSARGGMQPFAWRILCTSGLMPGGLDFTAYTDDSGAKATPRPGIDFGAKGLVDVRVSGIVSADAVPGSVFSLTLRAMGEKGSVTRPALALPTIVTGTPETESKTTTEVANWKEYLIAASAAVAIIIGFFIYRKARSPADKRKAADKINAAKGDADQTARKAGEPGVDTLNARSGEATSDPARTSRLKDALLKRAQADAVLHELLATLKEDRSATTNDADALRLDQEIESLREQLEEQASEHNADNAQVQKDEEREAAREK